MTETEVAVRLENHEQQIKSLKHRMDEQEEQGKTMNNLVVSVQELALNMKQMLEEQKSQGSRLSKLEDEPAKRWNTMTRTIFTSIVSTVGGALTAGIILMIAQYIK